MEYLKDVFGDKALTYEEFSNALQGKKDIKLANLAQGGYIGKEKYEALQGDMKALQKQLEDANGTIQEFKGMDLEGIQKAAKDWEEKYNNDTQELKAQLEARDYSDTMRAQVSSAGLKFSSAAAEKAFLTDLKGKELKREGETLVGFNDFVEQYQKSDPGAFAPAGDPPPMVVGHTPGAPSTKITKEAFVKMPYRARVELKSENPELYNQLKE